MIEILKYLLSYVIDITLYSARSSVNDSLKVIKRNGKNILNSNLANYSFGDLHKVFQIVFRKIELQKRKINHVLILGYGAGSVASIITDELKMNPNIIGVELDKEIINISKIYFPKNDKNANVIINSAENYLANCSDKFDLIIVDVFKDLSVPISIQSAPFIENLKSITSKDGLIIYNYVLYSVDSKNQLKNLQSLCAKVFGNIKTLEVLDFNRVLLMSNNND